ncbi:MAG: tetratricopeptide repeat protein [Alphaproteobacteria bacterium]|nr:tetratricopeptide repeat protein [Alphaproteobacteria bacterium]MBT4965599.1 tetratricopeptide repeat protein [Alphaproteobacteria bacterium]MBT5161217.1 tetratricopeptide repeat protein [Alphaproteobacteria bacterium]MBT5919683.1 tetratricopeptide repeat protein [Alphaproteobacteria bacterium]MBT6384413.1 tetratricopeptide repeat protein [Alphaproteobacteria bacterium]
MSESTIARRLAAILAADVVAYSRLMGADEDATMAQWWEYRREVIDPGIEKSGGRIVKHTGDGFLAEFASAFDAVKCALTLQGEINERSQQVAQDKRVQFRMGVNLGDIMSDDEDIYGDGVNIAARIEALADPGRVFVSGSIYEQIRSKPDFDCTSKGEHALKNIAEPMRVFDVCRAGEAPVEEIKPAAATVPQAPDPVAEEKPSIAVLPFDNMSGDEEQEYFADGITEDLITDLSKISGLLVIARNSVFTYKGTAVNIPDVCRELGVRWALEGSVRKSGNRVRVTAQLIDGSTGGHLWADRFDRNLDDIFAVQDEVTAEIVGALKVKLSAEDEARVGHRGTQDVEAYDTMLRTRELIISGSEGKVIEARILLQRILQNDPNFAAAMGGLAFTYIMHFTNQWGENHQTALNEAEKWVNKAIETDPKESYAWLSLAVMRVWQNRLDDAREAVARLHEVSPGSPDGLRILATIENFSGNYQTAIDAFQELIRLDPHGPAMALHTVGQSYFALGDWETAADYFRQRIAREPDTDSSYVFLAGTLGQLGQKEEAQENWKQVFMVKPDYSLAVRSRLWPYNDTTVADNLYAGLEKAGIDPGPR